MKKLLFFTIAVFLTVKAGYAQSKKTLPKTPDAKSSSAIAFQSSIARGQAVYNSYCISCHQADGGGVPNLNAPLIKSSHVLGDKSVLINILLKGMQGVDIDGESYANVMPPANYLSNQQIADVLTYIRNNFGNKANPVTVAEVNAIRKQ